MRSLSGRMGKKEKKQRKRFAKAWRHDSCGHLGNCVWLGIAGARKLGKERVGRKESRRQRGFK